ncbi:TPA: PIN domain-containing protein [Klebsiella aerogenes]|jgi:predicted nucleic acid-binding protein|uniref:PIN domain-containing protein n=2 Tax=Klebsiella aerogenes TaxID=548 RepID=A0AAW9DYT6_KLEAE|nr:MULTISPECIES: PIN domain-containing protein [Klebsiella]AKK82678.1 toxin-antitoxin system, toxin component, PIN family protein [Klebsiella aerogenes]AMH10014.1 PIN domain-containing protein [Klebsiella aerogenes]AMQ60121.1 PIN domain-containing protein [Klebsiella aerogenes]ATY05401.1 PIN domain-containing protein [Klebsiella aerogenes]AVE38778.1 PIN domain-containing protein [Klebsiella aerogenes]
MRHSPYPVILDACVLYPARLRDLLMHLGIAGLYQPKWSRFIHDEWCRNLLINRPDIAPEALRRTVDLMNAALPDANVTGFAGLINGLVLPDPDDRHVLAAAIRAKAEIIVTLNHKDFPAESLLPFEIETLHPDVFISDLFDLNHALALEAVRRQRQSLKHPPMTVDEFLEMLLKQGLPMTVKELANYQYAI